MYRKITYTAALDNVGRDAGKIAILQRPGRQVRYSVGELTKELRDGRVRMWDTSTGKGVAVDLWVDEKKATEGADFWGAAYAGLTDHFPALDFVFLDASGNVHLTIPATT
jgi:hypothetical protein